MNRKKGRRPLVKQRWVQAERKRNFSQPDKDQTYPYVEDDPQEESSSKRQRIHGGEGCENDITNLEDNRTCDEDYIEEHDSERQQLESKQPAFNIEEEDYDFEADDEALQFSDDDLHFSTDDEEEINIAAEPVGEVSLFGIYLLFLNANHGF